MSKLILEARDQCNNGGGGQCCRRSIADALIVAQKGSLMNTERENPSFVSLQIGIAYLKADVIVRNMIERKPPLGLYQTWREHHGHFAVIFSQIETCQPSISSVRRGKSYSQKPETHIFEAAGVPNILAECSDEEFTVFNESVVKFLTGCSLPSEELNDCVNVSILFRLRAFVNIYENKRLRTPDTVVMNRFHWLGLTDVALAAMVLRSPIHVVLAGYGFAGEPHMLSMYSFPTEFHWPIGMKVAPKDKRGQTFWSSLKSPKDNDRIQSILRNKSSIVIGFADNHFVSFVPKA